MIFHPPRPGQPVPPSDEDETYTLVSVTLSRHEPAVEAWRLEQLLHAGLSVREAETIASGDADLHAAVRAVKRGCPPDLAELIFG